VHHLHSQHHAQHMHFSRAPSNAESEANGSADEGPSIFA
jgi:hypothetical protein